MSFVDWDYILFIKCLYMRKKLIIGNWKMNLTVKESLEMAKNLAGTNFPPSVEVAVCPTFVSLAPVSVILEKTNIKLCAQDASWAELGKYTGEVSAEELEEIGVQYVLIGHSERRRYQNEDDHLVNKKMLHLINTNLTPILCVGEDYGTRQKPVRTAEETPLARRVGQSGHKLAELRAGAGDEIGNGLGAIKS